MPTFELSDFTLSIFLSIICLITGGILWAKVRTLALHSQKLLQDLDHFEKQTQRVKRDCERYAFEADWLKLTQEETQAPEKFLKLWKQWCINNSNLLGWVFGPNQTIAALKNTVKIPNVFRYLPDRKHHILLESSSHPELFKQLPSFIHKLHVFRCNDEPTHPAVFVVTELPRFITQQLEIENLAELTRYSRCLPQNEPSPIISFESDMEDLIAREMLEIRSLLDFEFQSPKEMMQGFLNKLATLSGYEFATLYLNDENEIVAKNLEHYASGGTLKGFHSAEEWIAGEKEYLNCIEQNLSEALLITTESIKALNIVVPFRCGLLIPVQQDQDSLGVVFLSHSDTTIPTDGNAQLIDWASSFLIQTLKKELSRTEIVKQARHDALTNLANRRTFDSEIVRLLENSQIAGEPFSIGLLDIDHFKSVNDQYGHPAGDAVLRNVAHVLEKVCRDLRVTDHALAARYGGEEFALLLPNISEQGALRIANEVREEISELKIVHDDLELKVTASVGLATTTDSSMGTEELIQKADCALYTAKKTGRNRVCHSQNAPEQSIVDALSSTGSTKPGIVLPH